MKFTRVLSFAIIGILLTCETCLVSAEFTGYPGVHNCTMPGVVALTFDDGPSPNGNTRSVLDVLREENVTATFFVTGRGHDRTLLDGDERKQILLRQIFSDGHQVASHTWTHSNLIKNRSLEDIHEDISRLALTVQSILGIHMTCLRPPYGYTNETVVKLIEDTYGYKVIRWNLDTKDWYFGKNIDASFKHYEETLGPEVSLENVSFITLHHDPVMRSGELARKAIHYVRSKGYRFVTVGECVGVPDFIR